LKYAVER